MEVEPLEPLIRLTKECWERALESSGSPTSSPQTDLTASHFLACGGVPQVFLIVFKQTDSERETMKRQREDDGEAATSAPKRSASVRLALAPTLSPFSFRYISLF